jgi:hypothetical protein
MQLGKDLSLRNFAIERNEKGVGNNEIFECLFIRTGKIAGTL